MINSPVCFYIGCRCSGPDPRSPSQCTSLPLDGYRQAGRSWTQSVCGSCLRWPKTVWAERRRRTRLKNRGPPGIQGRNWKEMVSLERRQQPRSRGRTRRKRRPRTRCCKSCERTVARGARVKKRGRQKQYRWVALDSIWSGLEIDCASTTKLLSSSEIYTNPTLAQLKICSIEIPLVEGSQSHQRGSFVMRHYVSFLGFFFLKGHSVYSTSY